MKLDKQMMRKLKELIVFTIIILIALWNYSTLFSWIRIILGVIFPFILGGAIAFVVNVPMNFWEKLIFRNKYLKEKKIAQRLARPVSMLLTIVIILGVIVLLMFVVIPQLTSTLFSLGRTLRMFIPEVQKFWEELFTGNSEVRSWLDSLNLDFDQLLNRAMSFFQNGAGNMLNTTIAAIGSIVSGVATFVIAFVFACYILLQKEKLHIQIIKVMYAFLPEKTVEWCLEVCSLTAKSFSSFLAGQCVEAMILGLMFFIVMTVLNMPYTLLISILIAITALIPIFGAFFGCLIGAFFILMEDPFKALIFVVAFLIVQQIEGNFIYPKVVGSSVGLPSIWVLAAVTMGGSLMGVVGMLIFIPITSVVYNLFRASVYKRLRRKYNDTSKKDIKKDKDIKNFEQND